MKDMLKDVLKDVLVEVAKEEPKAALITIIFLGVALVGHSAIEAITES